MSRPIAYNTSFPLSGSITTQQGGGLISYTIDGAGRDYSSFAGKKWVPSADGASKIIFVTDSATQGISTVANAVPLFYGCAGTSSAAILYTANRLPGSPGNYATVNDAITDLLSNDWFIIEEEEPFEGVNADKMVLDLDPSKLISYPGTGTVWYDISGKNNPSNLTNGPTFNSGGWFEFDGVNDYSVGQGGLVGPDCTVELWISSSNYNGTIPLSIDGNGYNSGPNIYFTSNIIAWNTGDGSGNPFNGSSYPDTKWHHIMVSNDFTGAAGFGQAALYIDGNFVGFANPLVATATQSANRFYIGRFHGGGYYTSGKFKAARIYDEAFTEARIKQNYFGSNIVTDGLVYALDANNIVSYSKSGTAAYSLVGGKTGTLVNGVGFDKGNGGSFEFDGADDYISTNFTQTFSDEITVEVWYRGDKTARNHVWDIGTGPTTNLSFDFNDGYDLWVYWNSGGANRVRYNIPGSFTDGNIKHVVYRHSGSNNDVYLNGEKLTITEQGGTQTFSPPVGGTMQLGRAGSAFYFQGNVYAYRVYQNALTPQQILQNYQAEQYRFEEPLNIPTYGLQAYWDASNLDSYPGSGTSWIDTVSGNDLSWSTPAPQFNINQFNTRPLVGYLRPMVSSGYINGRTGNGAYSVVAIFKPNATTSTRILFSMGPANSNCSGEGIHPIGINSSGRFSGGACGGLGTWGVSGGVVPTTTKYYCMATVFDGSTETVYIDGVFDKSAAMSTNTPVSSANRYNVGWVRNDGANYTLDAEIGVILYYNRVLTTDEVTQIYNAYKGTYNI